jgi:hypothetical protein
MQRLDWDHIDPDYPEGCDRPYQLVCGFSNPLNLIERDRSLNSSKSNRFLPWRVAKDEIGSVPVNPGDLCQFLDRATGDWVLEEFMGDWWFAQTRDLCGEHVSGVKNYLNKTGIHAPGMASKGARSQPREVKQKGGKRVFELKVGLGALTKQQLSDQGSLPWWYNPLTSETTRSDTSPGENWEQRRGPMFWTKPYENVNVDKYICLQTGYISTAAGVAAWQKKRGIDSSKRTKLTPEEAAFVFLWAP